MSPPPFKISKGVPIVGAGRPVVHLFPWSSMAAGDSFFIPHTYWTELPARYTRAVRNRVRSSFDHWSQRGNKTLLRLATAIRTEDGVEGCRVWLRQ